MGTGKMTISADSFKIFQVIGPGQYRPVKFGTFSTPAILTNFPINIVTKEEADEYRQFTCEC